MNLTNPELESLYELVRDKHDDVMRGDWEQVKEEISELHLLMHKLLKLQEKEETDLSDLRISRNELVEPGDFAFSTAETAKKLKVTESDLRALRNAKELKEGWHYIKGRSPRPSALWYDINRTCLQLHGVTWKEFSMPGFDVEANTRSRTAQAFEAARRSQKK
jgi:predicted DNA binding CopG/RHH family protein